MAESGYEKTEPATPRRRQEARQEGNVARSSDLTAACSLLGGMLLLHLLGPRLLVAMASTIEVMLTASFSHHPARSGALRVVPAWAMKILGGSVGLLIAGIMAVTIVAIIAQIGFLLTAKPLQPKLERLSPLRGLRNLMNLRAGVRLGMSVGKLLLVAAAATGLILLDLDKMMVLGRMDSLQMLAEAGHLVGALGIKLAAVLLLLALLDYAFTHWQRERELRMTKVQVADELKRMEGDPLTKQRRTRVARQLAMQRIGQEVPQADVVVTNPTHYAVALRYDPQTLHAPKVVAKGADLLAMRIRQLAIAHGVPMVERRELARTLYHSVEVGKQIPAALYNAVAEILAYVYRLSGRRTA